MVEGSGGVSVRRARVRAALLLGVAAFVCASVADAQMVVDPGTVIRTVQTSLWSPPSPDPSGIAYRPDTGQLITCDAEVEEVVQGWLRSPEHCANVMNPDFTQMGIAYAVNAQSEDGIYWTQVFGTPR